MAMIDKQALRLPGGRRLFASLLAFSFVDALATVTQAVCLAFAIVLLWEGAGLQTCLPYVGGFLLGFSLRRLVSFVRSGLLDRYAAHQADRLQKQLAEKVYEQGRGFVAQHGNAGVSTTLLEGIDQVETYLALILPKTADLLVIPVVLLVALFALDWISGLIALVILPCILLFMQLLGTTAKNYAAKQYREYGRLSNHFMDTMRGIATIKRFGRTDAFSSLIMQVSERFRVATIKTLRIATLSSLVLDLFGTFGLAAVAIMLGFRLLNGSIDFLPALACLILIPEYFGVIRRFGSDFHASLDGQNALASIMDMLQSTTEKTAAVVPSWNENCCIHLQNVSYHYPAEPDHTTLDCVELCAEGFTKVGLVGTSGAGKTTLVQLVAGFATATSGTIDINGTTVESLNCDSWQNQVCYLPQRPYLFNESLRDNICFYRPDATADEVREAVEAMGLTPLVESLPEGIDTVIGEGGRRLSGGQEQRIALARAFLDKGRRILIFDEPTAHLDIETEWALKPAMLRLMEGRLVFFATHRLHWLKDLDTVAVMEQGRVVEAGNPAALLATDGALSKLVAHLRGESA